MLHGQGHPDAGGDSVQDQSPAEVLYGIQQIGLLLRIALCRHYRRGQLSLEMPGDFQQFLFIRTTDDQGIRPKHFLVQERVQRREPRRSSVCPSLG